MIFKKFPALALLVVFLFAGCSPKPEPTPEATSTTEPPPLAITYCDIDPSDLCLDGFSGEYEDWLLVLFKADDRFFADIYILADGPDGEIYFECHQSEHFLDNVFCLGEPVEAGESIKLNIYSNYNDRLIALGVFNIEFGNLPFPDVNFEIVATSTPSPTPAVGAESTPNPSYPNPSYPNPDYPNP